ncbi:unnamed protein product [Onchocerca flexuosa]|uniref:Uncharacterized protein n=1 Tax=Onchocerca flexuosa TaxID=387005 RepID=A0A183HTB1_9BILA|nr:unnamed protein product [Onchocerca flexuosa]
MIFLILKKHLKKIFKKVEKEAYEKCKRLGIEIDQLPLSLIDVIQIIDMYQQDPIIYDLEENSYFQIS